MAKVRIELNKTEIGKLLKSKDIEEMLQKAAKSHADGWETDTKMMGSRVIASIYSSDRNEIDEEMDTHRIVGGLKR